MKADHRLLLFSVSTILMWGFWGFFGKLALDRKMSPITIFLAEILISAIFAVPVLLIFLRNQQTNAYPLSWNIFGLASGAGLALGLLFYYLALNKGQVSVVVPLTATYPVVSVLLGYAILGERPSVSQWIGVVMVIVGVMLLLSGPVSRVAPK